MRRLVLLLVLALALGGFFIAPAQAAEYTSTAALLDAKYLGPHSSVISGSDIVNVWRWYGIDVLPQLVILGAECSLGDPALGGGSVTHFNFGNLKAGLGGKWQDLASGTWYCPGQGTYLVFPDPGAGMCGFGRYLKAGPSFDPGWYKRLFDQAPIDWSTFARRYYGANVPGLDAYTANLYALESRFRARALAAGFLW